MEFSFSPQPSDRNFFSPIFLFQPDRTDRLYARLNRRRGDDAGTSDLVRTKKGRRYTRAYILTANSERISR